MVSDERERLARLRSALDRSLRSVARSTVTAVPRADAPASHGGRTAMGLPLPTPPSAVAPAAQGAVTVNVTLSGETIFLDDERRTRALAKEIKRLITEDRRRGLSG